MSISSRWRRVNKSTPCPVCKHPDWCAISTDGALAACRRIEAGGWRSKTDRAGVPIYLHRLDGAAGTPPVPPPSPEGPAPDRADADTLHAVYSALLVALPLADRHREALRFRGLTDEEIDRRGYGSLPVQGRARLAGVLRERWPDAVLRVPGIVTRERDGRRYLSLAGSAGLLVPVRDTAGRVLALLVRRDGDGGGPRYTYLSSARYGGPSPGAPVHVPLGVTAPCDTCRLTEGALKADVAAALSGLPTVGAAGLAWRPALDVVQALGSRTVRLALDADALDKAAVARTLDACAAGAASAGLAVELERWDAATAKGIDDALAAGAAVEVLAGDEARQAIGEIVAEGTAGEPPAEPSPLDRLGEVLAEGTPESLYRDGELLRALARLAEGDPAEFACRRAQLQRAGVRLRDLDRALAPLRQALRAERPPPDAAGCYRVSAGRIVRDVLTKEGTVEVPLATWAGRIVEEVVRDDGAERSLTLAVEGALADGTPLLRIEVPADEWPHMRWPVVRWGTRAVVLAGASTADHLRCALQLLSGEVPRQTVYAHTGWREVGGRWVYLHAGGAIGADGPVRDIAVSLPAALAGYVLPVLAAPLGPRELPPTGPLGEARRAEAARLAAAVRASLAVLDLAPNRITVPLLGAVYRAVLGGTDFSLHLAGPTGNFKTETAALAQQHFGPALDARHLPAGWSSTGNSLEAIAFAAKDALLCVDDFAPSGGAADVARLNREADRLLRAQGNSAGRQRMRADGSLRPERPPRGLILSTGEDVPRGQSLRARLLVLEVAPGDVRTNPLTACQQDAAAGLYAEALAGFLRWLAPHYPTIREGLRAETAGLRDRARGEGQHARTPGIVADLAAGWHWWLDYALAVGALDAAQRAELDRRVWAALEEAGAGQAEHVASAEPCGHFLRLLAAALASGRAHVAAPDGGCPSGADAWGWRTTGDGSDPLGRRIGWIEGPDLYLEPEAAYAEAQELARHQGDSLPVAPRTLWRRLRERGLLAGWDAVRQRNTVRRTLGGVRDRDVLYLLAATLSTCASPSEPSAGDAKPGNNRTVGADGPADGRTVGEAEPSAKTVRTTDRNGVCGRFGRSHTEEGAGRRDEIEEGEL
jgi:hypothetical protein